MKLSKGVKPISYLKQNTAEAIRYVHEQQSPIVITQNGEAKAVLIDIAEYEQDQESFATLKMIARAGVGISAAERAHNIRSERNFTNEDLPHSSRRHIRKCVT